MFTSGALFGMGLVLAVMGVLEGLMPVVLMGVGACLASLLGMSRRSRA